MMVRDPFRMIFVPPIAVVPRMMAIPIAVGTSPILVMLGPFGMMAPDPARMMVVPPIGIVPRMVLVPITIVVRMCHNRRSREEGRQCCGCEKCSKSHSGYLLRKGQWEVGIHLTSINTMHRKCQFQRQRNPEKKPQFRSKSPSKRSDFANSTDEVWRRLYTELTLESAYHFWYIEAWPSESVSRPDFT